MREQRFSQALLSSHVTALLMGAGVGAVGVPLPYSQSPVGSRVSGASSPLVDPGWWCGPCAVAPFPVPKQGLGKRTLT